MKKILVFFLAILMVCGVLTSCGKPAETTAAQTVPEQSGEENERSLAKDSLPADLNYSSLPEEERTINFFVRDYSDTYKYEIACEELMNDTLHDAIHYRNIDVENRLGVEIKTSSMLGSYAARNEWFNHLTTTVQNNTGEIDVAAFNVASGAPYALQGIYRNLSDFSTESGGGYLDLSKPWWNQSIIDNTMVAGKLFFIGGDVTISLFCGAHCLFFNKNLFAEKFPDDVKQDSEMLYNLVKNKKWTIDRMINYVSQVHDDSNNNNIFDDGDVAGYKNYYASRVAELHTWFYSLGAKATAKNQYGEFEVVVGSDPRVVPAYEKFVALYSSEGTLISPEGKIPEEITNMAAGNLLFFEWALQDGESMRQSSVPYGVLPLPMYDEEQGYYANTPSNSASMLSICSNLSADRAKMVSAVMELMTVESYKKVTPSYYSTVVTGTYSKDEVDAQMFDLIIETVVLPFEFFYSNGFSPKLGSLFSSYERDIRNYLDSNKDNWPIQMEELIDALSEVGD